MKRQACVALLFAIRTEPARREGLDRNERRGRILDVFNRGARQRARAAAASATGEFQTVVLGLVLLGALASCTWRQSLLTIHDAGRADATADSADAGPAVDAPSVCWGRPKIGAGNGPNEGLLVWYRCESLSGTTLVDSSGRGNDGILASGSGSGLGATIVAGKIDNALELKSANKGYVSMPAGLLAQACEVTVATWVYLITSSSTTNAWTRIWDFGVDTNRYMFLTPVTNTDDVAHFGITVAGNGSEDALKLKTAVPVLKWTHVAVVLGPSGGTLYWDGEVADSDETMVLRPADIGFTAKNYIGRSQFSTDPYLDGAIDDFRVYDRALSPSEIKTLATGS
jgi:hypothetical protein